MMVVLPVAVPRTKFVGERPTSSRTRIGKAAAAERGPSPFNEIIFDSRKHYKQSKLISNREILHKRVINFENQGPDFMHERIGELGWSFITQYTFGEGRSSLLKMPSITFRNKRRSGMWWDTYNPKSDRVDNGILTTNARGWLKMIICNLQPLRHETTINMDTALLLYTLMSEGHIHLGCILNKSMYQATSGAKDKRLAFPVMITKMAAAQGVPTYPADQIVTVPRKEKFCPFGDWQKAKKKARKADLPHVNPPPIPPPIHEP
ncbi:hypothetical protein PIB30_075804 [Stylosanthes scabra]|uniref:Putative plant transposon protein domain-containing protein n=1 Tax=Stylosanthes scabra TaxID=79078 RepID=A0ABU6VR92_9FABA|nr:hypothetical protein [Stylosanthes scabra]